MPVFDMELIITDGERGSSVCHDDDCLVPHLSDVFQHTGFRLFIQGTCRLVQEKNRGIREQSSRNRHTLGLAFGEADAAFTKAGVQPYFGDKIIQAGSTDRSL